MSEMAVRLALWLWRTDITFYQYPYGPPNRGLRYRLAWLLYHWTL